MGKINDSDLIPRMKDCPYRDANGTKTPFGRATKYRQCPSESDKWRLREYVLDNGKKIYEVSYSFLDVMPSYKSGDRQKSRCVWFAPGDLEPIVTFPYMFSDKEVARAQAWMKEGDRT